VRVVLIGSVRSSATTLDRLVSHGFDLAAVFGYAPSDHSLVSGFVDLEPSCRSHGIPFVPFRSVNSGEVRQDLNRYKPDVIFVVGLSQLIAGDLIAAARLGCVGYHPTALPLGRGRAPLAWLILDGGRGASTFFQLTESADSGGVFIQEPYEISKDDDAAAVEAKVLESIGIALDKWLPDLKSGIWNPRPQNEEDATYYGRRALEDGLIDWRDSAVEIDRLIKASTRPHPGAFTYRGLERLRIWRCRAEEKLPYRGVRGRVVLMADDGSALVQTGRGLIWLLQVEFETETSAPLRVGEKLGYDVELELNRLMRSMHSAKDKVK